MKPTFDEDEFGFPIIDEPAYRIEFDPPTQPTNLSDFSDSLVFQLLGHGLDPNEIRQILAESTLRGTGEELLGEAHMVNRIRNDHQDFRRIIEGRTTQQSDPTMESIRDISISASQSIPVDDPVQRTDPVADLLEEKHTAKRRNLDI